MRGLTEEIKYSLGEKKADLVLKNASILNVFTKKIIKNDVGVKDGKIVGIGRFSGIKEIDCSDKYVTPLFIDAHVHIESSMMTPSVFSQEVLKKGVGTIIADPHEIANVLGEKGIEFMINDTAEDGADIFYMLPSCVPATDIDDNGAEVGVKELKRLKQYDNVIGLGEVMDVPAVIAGREDMIQKLELFNGEIIDGHCPNISKRWLNAYVAAGVMTDHECSTSREALEKIELGMKILVREGSAAKELKKLIPAVNKENAHMFCFCTDDRHIDDIMEEGTINNCVKRAIDLGMDPVLAYTLASYNAARIYNLKDRGAVAPGFKADLLILDDLEDVSINRVIKNGKEVTENRVSVENKYIFQNTIKISEITSDLLKVKSEGDLINVIKVIPNSIVTKKEVKQVITEGEFVSEVKGRRINKIAVFGRHTKLLKYSVGYIDGFGIKNCALAQSISHDSHNIVCVGDSDEDMTKAVNKVIQMGGGIALVCEGKVMESIALPIGGLMTNMSPEFISDRIRRIKEILNGKGISGGVDPLITLSFMSITVIPTLKITPRGLYDYNINEFIPLFIKQ
ncbi:adenine deaminase [Oceanirhabdus sp. W0125-5]|uniref:adenine deaminase n=1 Tax=Oceanirhabdus sp. W0125-5 TaxID=2999116 RepID=UPI0022F2F144|nr:adenine deaminase [Oceanirhabdus sp. W0125-5]WBW96150.1 adenine deaminase [Oceanirhabdus sp. W0125-5]